MSDQSKLIIFPLSKDNRVEIRLEKAITKSEFELLKKMLELLEDYWVDGEAAQRGEEGKRG